LVERNNAEGKVGQGFGWLVVEDQPEEENIKEK